MTPKLPEEFTQKLAAAQMVFEPPRGSVPVPFKENGAVRYNHAVRISPDLEVRYQIYSAADMGKPFTDQQSRVFLLSIISNIAERVTAEPSDFPEQAVQGEFGAAWGCTCGLQLRPSVFAGGFRECMLVMLSRHERGEAFIYYLYSDIKKVAPLIEQHFHALRFDDAQAPARLDDPLQAVMGLTDEDGILAIARMKGIPITDLDPGRGVRKNLTTMLSNDVPEPVREQAERDFIAGSIHLKEVIRSSFGQGAMLLALDLVGEELIQFIVLGAGKDQKGKAAWELYDTAHRTKRVIPEHAFLPHAAFVCANPQGGDAAGTDDGKSGKGARMPRFIADLLLAEKTAPRIPIGLKLVSVPLAPAIGLTCLNMLTAICGQANFDMRDLSGNLMIYLVCALISIAATCYVVWDLLRFRPVGRAVSVVVSIMMIIGLLLVPFVGSPTYSAWQVLASLLLCIPFGYAAYYLLFVRTYRTIYAQVQEARKQRRSAAC